ncbi:MAG: hypothetical protein WD768_12600 [Phycisphaeraceae bacterium]
MTEPMIQRIEPAALAALVSAAVAGQPVTDLHTHVFSPRFGSSPDPHGLMLWGIDDLVTYHYLIAEVFRVVPANELPYYSYFSMSKQEQADHIWKHLFVERTPLSEACRGVITTLSKLGLDPHEKTLEPYRKWFSEQEPGAFVDKVMQIANVDQITMTNEFFNDNERHLWLHNPDLAGDTRFAPVLRIDKLLLDWPGASTTLRECGYDVRVDFSGTTMDEITRFLHEWIERMKAVYVATSLPPEFHYPTLPPERNHADRIIRDALLPVLHERNMPWALMIGAKRGANPALRDAGDMGGRADITAVVNLCRQFSDNRFMVTMLSRENQHELCVAARKFGNLFVFGCWWFLNNPSLIEEITLMRLELLGSTFAPQHSDARILDQLVYKWDHSRTVIAKVLTEKYTGLAESGYHVSEEQIKKDVALLLRDNYRKFVGMTA